MNNCTSLDTKCVEMSRVECSAPTLEFCTSTVECGTPIVGYSTPTVECGTLTIECCALSVQYGTPTVEYGMPTVEYGTPTAHLRHTLHTELLFPDFHGAGMAAVGRGSGRREDILLLGKGGIYSLFRHRVIHVPHTKGERNTPFR